MARQTTSQIICEVLLLVAAHRNGEISWDEMIVKLPEDEDYNDEELAELLDLLEHEPSEGLLPSARSVRRNWETRTSYLIDRLRRKTSNASNT